MLRPRALTPVAGEIIIAADKKVMTQKKPGREYLLDISATRLSLGDPVGFPSHSHEWFSIIVYQCIKLCFGRGHRTSKGELVKKI